MTVDAARIHRKLFGAAEPPPREHEQRDLDGRAVRFCRCGQPRPAVWYLGVVACRCGAQVEPRRPWTGP